MASFLKMRNNPVTTWSLAPKTPSLARDEVHVWRATLDQGPTLLHSLREVLAAGELDRATRFYRQQDRERFIASRGLLREILSKYLGIEPRELHFEYSPFGKPMLVRPCHRDIGFSLSRSSGLSLYAITASREVGVDVENVRMDFPFEPAATRFFSAAENAMLAALPENVRQQAFFDFWTRKEAYAKASGAGLWLPFDRFAVHPRLSVDFPNKNCWSLWNLVPRSGFVGAVAVEGGGRLVCWEWNGALS